MLKAVIFDMDGVLVDSEPLHYEINKLTAKRHCGIELDYEYYKQYYEQISPEYAEVLYKQVLEKYLYDEKQNL